MVTVSGQGDGLRVSGEVDKCGGQEYGAPTQARVLVLDAGGAVLAERLAGGAVDALYRLGNGEGANRSVAAVALLARTLDRADQRLELWARESGRGMGGTNAQHPQNGGDRGPTGPTTRASLQFLKHSRATIGAHYDRPPVSPIARCRECGGSAAGCGGSAAGAVRSRCTNRILVPKRQERQKKQFNPISITWAMKDSRTDESADPWAAVMTKRTTTAIDHIATQVPPLELGKSVIISFQTTQI